MPNRFVVAAVVSLGLLLGACASVTQKTKATVLEETLRSYGATIRWGDIAQAQAFVDPAYREAHPLTPLELQRFQQVQISAYREQPAVPVGDNEVTQVVEIGLVNVNTQSARSVIDRQRWRYEEKTNRWWLMTGLPDITRKN